MASDSPTPKVPQSLEGLIVEPMSEKDVREVVAQACDYRGDVTIQLKTGEEIIGYVFDHQGEGVQGFLKIFLADREKPEHVSIKDIQHVVFSGEDTAFGRSWEDWVMKWKKTTPEP